MVQLQRDADTGTVTLKRRGLVWRGHGDVSVGLEVAGHRELGADDVLDGRVGGRGAAAQPDDDDDPAVRAFPDRKLPKICFEFCSKYNTLMFCH